MKKNITILNIFSNLLLQFFTIISAFIVPKIIISYFGSEVNGLIASINQFLSYISLLEGGITAVITAKLYKPILDNDYKKISSIMNTSKKFYQKIGIMFFIYSVVFALLGFIVYNNTSFSFLYLFFIILILSIVLLIQYMLSINLRTLLIASKRGYIISFVQIAIVIVNIILVIICVNVYPNVHVLKLITGCTYVLQPIIYGYYVKKYFRLDKSVPIEKALIKERWDGFANNIAYFIHTSTDIVILTIFSSLINVSVYTIYTLITNGLKSILNSINNAVYPSIGQIYANGNLDNLNKKFEVFETLYLFIVFFIITISILLITPFVCIYVGKDNINNVYYNPIFGILILIGLLFDLLKTPYVNLSYSANLFKKLTIPCFIEAFLNIIISIILVNKLGLIGVAIGTIVAMIYRYVYQINLAQKIMKKSQYEHGKMIVLLSIISVISIIICSNFITYKIDTIFNWIVCACIYGIIILFNMSIVSCIFFKKRIKNVVNEFKYLFVKHTK